MAERLHLLLLRLYRRLPRPGRRFVVHRMAPCFTVGAMCLIERADGALLLVRSSYRGRWGFPGGLLRRGESATDGARRELSEELALEIELVGAPAVVVEPRYRRVDVVHRARLAEGTDAGGVGPSSPEILEVGWFAPEDLPELQPESASALVSAARSWGLGQPSPVQPDP